MISRLLRALRLTAIPVLLVAGVLCAAEQVPVPKTGQEEPKADTPKKEEKPATKESGGEATKAQTAEEARKEQLAEAARNEAYRKLMESGRVAFSRRNYAEALAHFREASVLIPNNHYAALLSGVAAYWNREPRVALDYWAPLAEKAQKNSPEEWEATRHLVMAWHALNEDERAEQGVQRMYDLRSKARLPQAMAANGFTRQHLWLGTRRVGVWEHFDERGERSRVWEFHVVETKDGDEKEMASVAVELEPQAEGKVGYVLVEDGPARRVYKRWPAKPSYVEARNLAVAAVKGQLKYLDADATTAVPDTQAGATAETKATGTAAANTPTPGLTKPGTVTAEQARLAKILGLKLSPAATRILALVAKLAGVDFDVTKYVRLSLSDPAAARKFEKEGLTGSQPQATGQASDLVQFIASAKAPDLQEAFRNVGTALAGSKGDYARFVLLTALNTRGGDMPLEFLSSCLGSEDFVVRETAALLLARGGHKEGLEALFKELAALGEGKSGDEAARIVSFPLEELLGSVLGPCPIRDTVGWRESALAWWKQNEAKIGYVKGAPAGQPVWRPAK